MIEASESASRNDALLAHARDWALDSLLELPLALEHDSDSAFSGRAASPALQQLQTVLCTAVSAPANALEELQEAVFSAFALQQTSLEPAAFTRMLELCATSVRDDLECVLFLDAMLVSCDVFTAPPALLERLLRVPTEGDAEARTRLFEQLSETAKVRVWGNHIPTWEAQVCSVVISFDITYMAVITVTLDITRYAL